MPLYDYDCAACGRRFELIHGVHAEPPTACPLCGAGPIRKAIVAAAVHYKGSGWAKKERRVASRTGGSSASDDTSAGDGETRPAASTADAGSASPTAGADKGSGSNGRSGSEKRSPSGDGGAGTAPKSAPAVSGD